MNDEMLKRLDALAAKLGTTAEQMWAILVAGEAKMGATYALLGAILFLGMAVACYALFRYGVRDETGDDVAPACFVGGTVCGGLGLIGFFVIWYGVLSWIAPEYYAIRYVLGAIK